MAVKEFVTQSVFSFGLLLKLTQEEPVTEPVVESPLSFRSLLLAKP